jgi:Family of unknown function (DUF5317)
VLMGAVAVLALLTVPLTGGRLGRLKEVQLRHVWLLALALAAQVMITDVVTSGWTSVLAAVHGVTYLLAGAFIVLNRHLRGLMIIASGAACNATAIIANGGTLPASAAALARAGRAPLSADRFANSGSLPDPRLSFLGDQWAIPSGWPLANVYSVGDLVIVVGIFVTVHLLCRPARPSVDRHGDQDPLIGLHA